MSTLRYAAHLVLRFSNVCAALITMALVKIVKAVDGCCSQSKHYPHYLRSVEAGKCFTVVSAECGV